MLTLWDIAKEKLIKEIKAGTVKDETSAAEVHAKDPVYQAVKIENFKSNLRSLRKRMQKFRAFAEMDEISRQKDRELYPIDYQGRWGGSEADRLLKADMKEGKHKEMKPCQLRETRIEFQLYDKDQFRKHIYQVEREGKETMYWLVVKAEKKKKKDDKRARKEALRLQIEKDPLQGLTVVQLKEKLREYSLKVGGKKQDLIQRIKDHEAQQ